MDIKALNELALEFKNLHISGKPIVLANVYDVATTKAVAEIVVVKAVATTSFAIAAVNGIRDDDLTQQQNLAAVDKIGAVAGRANLMFTVDIQDGYDDIPTTIKAIIDVGAVGCNIEDTDISKGVLRSKQDAVGRIRTVLRCATEAGVPNFVVNARTDTLGYNGDIAEAIERAQAFITAGATTAFVWGGAQGRGLRTEEIALIASSLQGRLSVMTAISPDMLDASELGKLGVARVSFGPAGYIAAMKGFTEVVSRMLST